MLILSWRAWAWGAAGALLAGATLAALLALRAEAPADALAASLPALFLTAAFDSASASDHSMSSIFLPSGRVRR